MIDNNCFHKIVAQFKIKKKNVFFFAKLAPNSHFLYNERQFLYKSL